MASQSADGAQSNNVPPPFLTKTYDMVDDPATDPIVSWSSSNSSFVVWNHSEFARDLLPKYFKHNNFSSFVRQLNTYGFRKVDPDRWEFANEGFARGKRHLLKNIHRRKPSHSHSQQQQQAQSSTLGCVEVGKYGLDGEIERLKRDKNTLMMELVKLRQQQQATERELQTLGSRLQSMEQRQQQMMTFLAKAMQNPEFLSQIVQQNENNMRLTAAKKKRRLPEEQEKSVKEPNDSDGQIVKYQPSNKDANNSVFMQLSHSDMLSKQELPQSSLESFLRDLQHFPVEKIDGGNLANHSSGVTLTEMNPSAIFPDELVGGIPGQPTLGLPDSPLAFPEADEVGDSGSGDFKVSEFMGEKADNPEVREVKVESMLMDLNLNEKAKLSSANEVNTNDVRTLVSNKNDVFWEQFLTESPSGSTDTDTEVATENLENVHVHEIFGGRWWINRSNVDQLTQQMGQLVSASRH